MTMRAALRAIHVKTEAALIDHMRFQTDASHEAAYQAVLNAVREFKYYRTLSKEEKETLKMYRDIALSMGDGSLH